MHMSDSYLIFHIRMRPETDLGMWEIMHFLICSGVISDMCHMGGKSGHLNHVM